MSTRTNKIPERLRVALQPYRKGVWLQVGEFYTLEEDTPDGSHRPAKVFAQFQTPKGLQLWIDRNVPATSQVRWTVPGLPENC